MICLKKEFLQNWKKKKPCQYAGENDYLAAM